MFGKGKRDIGTPEYQKPFIALIFQSYCCRFSQVSGK